MLHEFVSAHRGEIISRCRAKAASRSVAPSAQPESNHGVPLFLDQLSDALRLGLTTSPEISTSAIQHGHDLLRRGLSLSQVVHTYGDVCQAVTELAVERQARITAEDFRTLNGCLDDAIAGAVTEYARERTRSDIDGEAARGSERLGFFAHEMRNLINTATMAFEVLKTGNVGVTGVTSSVLERSLRASRALIDRSLAEVRLTHGTQHREPFLVSAFINEVVSASTLEANSRAVTLILVPGEEGLTIKADRQVLAAVVGNLLQNAFKFTRPATTVTLRVGASAERVRIDIEDECGGLPSGNVEDLFRPFEQRGANRTGVGLGLVFSRWGAEANEGRVYASNVPDKGCVFTLDLPRLPNLVEGI